VDPDPQSSCWGVSHRACLHEFAPKLAIIPCYGIHARIVASDRPPTGIPCNGQQTIARGLDPLNFRNRSWSALHAWADPDPLRVAHSARPQRTRLYRRSDRPTIPIRRGAISTTLPLSIKPTPAPYNTSRGTSTLTATGGGGVRGSAFPSYGVNSSPQ